MLKFRLEPNIGPEQFREEVGFLALRSNDSITDCHVGAGDVGKGDWQGFESVGWFSCDLGFAVSACDGGGFLVDGGGKRAWSGDGVFEIRCDASIDVGGEIGRFCSAKVQRREGGPRRQRRTNYITNHFRERVR